MSEWLIDEVFGSEQLEEIASRLLKLTDSKIFLFDAPMGAGKTTLIKEMCRQLGSNDHFSSPTYAIVNEYASPQGKIFHFDLYRLKNSSELLDLGIEEYLDADGWCFFEWPDMVKDLIDAPAMEVQLSVENEKRRVRARLF